MSCQGCYYFMQGKASPCEEGWCGFRGGEISPSDSCESFKPRTIPLGLAIARSRRVVSLEDLAAENEAFAEVTGRGDYRGY